MPNHVRLYHVSPVRRCTMLRFMYAVLALTFIVAWSPLPTRLLDWSPPLATANAPRSPLARTLRSAEGQQLLHDVCRAAGNVAATAVDSRDSGMPSSVFMTRLSEAAGLTQRDNPG